MFFVAISYLNKKMPRPFRRSTPRPVNIGRSFFGRGFEDSRSTQPGQTVVDCTLGWGRTLGAGVAQTRRFRTGVLIGLDLDATDNLPKVKERLDIVGNPGSTSITPISQAWMAFWQSHGLDGADMVLADLGMSSMQKWMIRSVAFSYARDGSLDMRMDRSRGRGAAQLLATIREEDLCQASQEFGDEPNAPKIAAAILENQRGDAHSHHGPAGEYRKSWTRPMNPIGDYNRSPANGKPIPPPAPSRAAQAPGEQRSWPTSPISSGYCRPVCVPAAELRLISFS